MVHVSHSLDIYARWICPVFWLGMSYGGGGVPVQENNKGWQGLCHEGIDRPMREAGKGLCHLVVSGGLWTCWGLS